MTKPELSLRLRSYLDAIGRLRLQNDAALVSLILFGSAAKGGASRPDSDVDLIVVIPDAAPHQERMRITAEVARLETQHGFKPPLKPSTPLQAFAKRICGNDLSCFVCTRSDLLSGDIARIFDLTAAEAFLVDRIVLANIIASAVTVQGEDLLPQVHPPQIRRLDIFKSCFAFVNQLLFLMATYRLLPNATRYAMGTLKHSLHSCYFCYHRQTANLEEEVAFFEQQLGPNHTLQQLIELRAQYRNAYSFVLRCLPTLLKLHIRTAQDNAPHRNTNP